MELLSMLWSFTLEHWIISLFVYLYAGSCFLNYVLYYKLYKPAGYDWKKIFLPLFLARLELRVSYKEERSKKLRLLSLILIFWLFVVIYDFMIAPSIRFILKPYQ